MKLLKKEFRLCMHPAALIMMGLSALILIPNYPYAVSYFYMTLGIYFICLDGRENHDPTFTLCLPVSRRQAAEGRILFVCCLEGAQLTLCFLMMLLHRKLLGPVANEAGMDANIALTGQGLIAFGLFNLIFFPGWYKDINKLGGPFVRATVAVFLYIAVGVVLTYAVPFVRDVMDRPDDVGLSERLIYDGAALIFFLLATFFSVKLSVRRFERQDLQL